MPFGSAAICPSAARLTTAPKSSPARCSTRSSKSLISRYADFRSLDRATILADNFANGGLVFGAAVPNWEALDFGATTITVTENGEAFASSKGGAPRDPIAALVDFAELMRRRGGAKAGTFVTTGSWTGLVFTKRGARIVADFGSRGRVEVAFPADE